MKFVPLSPHAPVQTTTLTFCDKPPVMDARMMPMDEDDDPAQVNMKAAVMDKTVMMMEYEHYNDDEHHHYYHKEATAPYPSTMHTSYSSTSHYYPYYNHSTPLLPPPPPLLRLPLQKRQCRRRHRRMVHFADESSTSTTSSSSLQINNSKNQVYHNPRTLSEREISRRWYNANDYARFHQDMRAIVLRTRHVEQYGYGHSDGGSSLMENASDNETWSSFDSDEDDDIDNNNNNNDSSHSRHHWRAPLLYVYQAFGTATSPAQVQPVLDQVRHDYQLRITAHNVGLERLGIPDIQTDYQQRRQELWGQIHALQNMQHVLTASERALHIAEAVEYYSRVGRLYARYTAYLAAKERHD